MAPSLKSYGDLLRTYLRPQWPRVLALALLLTGSITLQLVGPQILRYFIDAAGSGATLQTLTTIGLGYLSLALATQAISVAETYVAENVGWTAANRLRADLALHCLLLDPAFHNAHTPGDLIERVDGDVATLGNFFSRFVVYVLGNAFLLAGVLVLLFRIHWQVGAAMAGFVVAGLVFVNRMRNVAVPYWAAARQASADVFGYLEERMGGVEDIRSNGATINAMRGFYAVSRDHLGTRKSSIIPGDVV